MVEIYGMQWIKSYGEKPNHSWIAGLEDLTPNDIGYGIDQTIKSGSPYLPSLPEFRERCLGITNQEIIDYCEQFMNYEDTYAQRDKKIKLHWEEARRSLTQWHINESRHNHEKEVLSIGQEPKPQLNHPGGIML
jgi:hypothetical protein